MDLRMIMFNNKQAAELIAKQVSIAYNPVMDVCIARVKHGELLGGVIYQMFNGVSAVAHVASSGNKKWLNRDMLWIIFHYPFVQVGLHKLIGIVGSTDIATLKFDANLGFTEECRIKDAAPFGDVIILTMAKHQCRFLDLRPDNYKLI